MPIVANETITVKSPAFAEYEYIPSKYTCNGSDINPELNLIDIPKGTKSLALIVEDSDVRDSFVHWLMWNIPVQNKIEENSAPGVQGRNGNNLNRYMGACPPSGTHHYHFRIYALDTTLDLPINTDRNALLKAIDKHVLGFGELVGLYKNQGE